MNSDAAVEVLSTPGLRLAGKLKHDRALSNEGVIPQFGLYGLEGGPDMITSMLPHIARELVDIQPYSVLDLACNNGGKMPLIAAWGCTEYLGWEGVEYYAKQAQSRWGGGFAKFECHDIVKEDLPEGFDVVLLSFIIQHLPLKDALTLLDHVDQIAPLTIIMLDNSFRLTDAATCASDFARVKDSTLIIPKPITAIKEALRSYVCTNPTKELYIWRHKSRINPVEVTRAARVWREIAPTKPENAITVLDLGCAGGEKSTVFGAGMHITGVDADESKLAHAKKLLDEAYLGYFETVVPKLLSRHAYDWVLMMDSLEHMDMAAGEQLIKQLKARCSAITVFTPYGNIDAWRGHRGDNQEHKSAWLPEDFTRLGMEYKKLTDYHAPGVSALLAWWKR